MSFDGFFMHHLILELHNDLKDSRLEKVQAVDLNRFLLHFYHQGKKNKLLISCDTHHFYSYLIHDTLTPIVANQFVNNLKKHLEGSILEKITQHQTDRVMIFTFRVMDLIEGAIEKHLVFEAMGKHSNLILVSNHKIIDCHKKMFFESGRQLLPQATFEYFPSDKKPFTELNYDYISAHQDLVSQYMGISPLLAKFLILGKPDILSIPIQPTYDLESKKFYALDVFDSSHEKIYFSTLSELLNHLKPLKSFNKQSQELFIDAQLKKLYRKKDAIERSYEDAKKLIELKHNGDLIYQSGLDLALKHSSISVDTQKIILDPLKTLNENAQHYYKRYQKGKRALTHLETQLFETQEIIDVFLEFLTYLEFSNEESIKDLNEDLSVFGYKVVQQKNKKAIQKPNISIFEYNQAKIYVGKNSKQNQYITHELSQKEDFWFHVKDAPGAHILVKTPQLDEQIIRKAAALAAYYSKLKYSSSIPVDYTQIKYIKKIPKNPLYKVTYQVYKTIFIDIDETEIIEFMKHHTIKRST